MKTINKLESSINILTEGYTKLKKECDRAFNEAERARNDLHDAKETIKELSLSMEEAPNKSQSIHGLENGKKEIIDTVQSILSRLEKI